tara:strand:+ start:378 stop:764 length:387 start_codon:yes stop_codon:yes gene_type:complete
MANRKTMIDKLGKPLAAVFLCLSILFSQFAHAEPIAAPLNEQATAATAIACAIGPVCEHDAADSKTPEDHRHSPKAMDGKCATDCPSVFVVLNGSRTSDRMPIARNLPIISKALKGSIPSSDDRPPRT